MMMDPASKAQSDIAQLIGQQAIQIASLKAQLEAVTAERDALKAKQAKD
jgi:hypothetical protein